jgi:uncharacterized membrane protein YgcG
VQVDGPIPVEAGEEGTMRIKLAVVAAAAVTVVGGTGAAAYAVVGHSTVSPTVAGNDLPIDDNHSPVPTSRPAEPGDDRGRDGAPATVEPGDDHGTGAEPGDDRGPGRGTDDVTPEPGDDRGGRGPAATTTAVPVRTPDRSGGSGGPGPGADDSGGGGSSGGGGGSGRGGADDGGGHR